MQNYILVKPRFSDFNGQGLLKASIHLDLACESQLEQMPTRYGLPFEQFAEKGLRWHIAKFDVEYSKVVRGMAVLRVEADVVKVDADSMTVAFAFYDKARETRFAYGTIRFDLVDRRDSPVALDEQVRRALIENGRME